MYINSSSIEIYPTAKRGKTSNLMLEKNITDISNNITDINNYNISLELYKDNNVYKLRSGKCVIKGYIIEITNDVDLSELQLSTGTSLYLELGSITGNVLQGYDNTLGTYSGKYTGVILTTTTPSNDKYILIADISSDGQIKPGPVNQKLIANNTAIDLSSTSGLVDNNFKGTFEDWLLDNFIIDDGDI